MVAGAGCGADDGRILPVLEIHKLAGIWWGIMPIYYRPKEAFDVVPSSEIAKYIGATSDPDMQMCLIMAWLTGARIIEITGLKKDDVNTDGDFVQFTIKAAKGGKTGFPTFNLRDPFVTELATFIDNKEAGEGILSRGKSSYQKKLHALNEKIYGERTGKWITFHYLRHSRITWLARHGATALEVKSWTGHRSSAFEEYFAATRVRRFAGKIK